MPPSPAGEGLVKIQALSYNLKQRKIYVFYQSAVESYGSISLLQWEKVSSERETDEVSTMDN